MKDSGGSSILSTFTPNASTTSVPITNTFSPDVAGVLDCEYSNQNDGENDSENDSENHECELFCDLTEELTEEEKAEKKQETINSWRNVFNGPVTVNGTLAAQKGAAGSRQRAVGRGVNKKGERKGKNATKSPKQIRDNWSSKWAAEFEGHYIVMVETQSGNEVTIRCQVCQQGLAPDKNSIGRHVNGKGHIALAKRFLNATIKDDKLLAAINDDSNKVFIDQFFEGVEDSAKSKAVVRTNVARALLLNGVPFNILEENSNELRLLLQNAVGMRLTRNQVSKLIPMALFQEMLTLREELLTAKNNRYAVSFDGTTDYSVGELLIFTIRFVNQDGFISTRLGKLSLYEKSHDGKQLAAAVKQYLTGGKNLSDETSEAGPFNVDNICAYVMRDGCAVNGAALRHLDALNLDLLVEVADNTCLAHSINLLGDTFRAEFPLACEVVNSWSRIVRRSSYARQAFLKFTQSKAERKAAVRWYADFPVAMQIADYGDTILRICTDKRIAGLPKTCEKVLALLQGESRAKVHLELARLVDGMSPLYDVIHILEGDGFVAPVAFQLWTKYVTSQNEVKWTRSLASLEPVAASELAREMVVARRKKERDAVIRAYENEVRRLERESQDEYEKALSKYEDELLVSGNKRRRRPSEKVKSQKSGGDDIVDMQAPQRETFVKPLPPLPPPEDASELVVTDADIAHVRERFPEKVQQLVNTMRADNGDNGGLRVKGSLRKAEQLTNGRLATTLDLMRASRLCNFAFVATTNQVALTQEVKDFVGKLGFIAVDLNRDDIIEKLQSELVSAGGYIDQAKLFMQRKDGYDKITIAGKKADDLPMPYEMWKFWEENELRLPNWANVSNNVALIATSSADAERGFSMYTGLISNQQKSSLEDKIEATVLIRHNETQRRLEARQLQKGREVLQELHKMNRDMRAAAYEGAEEED